MKVAVSEPIRNRTPPARFDRPKVTLEPTIVLSRRGNYVILRIDFLSLIINLIYRCILINPCLSKLRWE
jgi:hypothetical protein